MNAGSRCSPDSGVDDIVTQWQWRICGGLTVLIASAMAVYAVLSDVLHDSAMVIVALSSAQVAEAAVSIERVPLIVFWGVFALLICFALYLAAVDIRHIRRQYAEERRDILRRTLQDQSFRETLRERTRPSHTARTNGNGHAS